MNLEYLEQERKAKWAKLQETQCCPDCGHHAYTFRKMQRPKPHWKFRCAECKLEMVSLPLDCFDTIKQEHILSKYT